MWVQVGHWVFKMWKRRIIKFILVIWRLWCRCFSFYIITFKVYFHTVSLDSCLLLLLYVISKMGEQSWVIHLVKCRVINFTGWKWRFPYSRSITLRMERELEIAHVLSICTTLSSVASCCLAPPKYYVFVQKKKYTISLNSYHSNVQMLFKLKSLSGSVLLFRLMQLSLSTKLGKFLRGHPHSLSLIVPTSMVSIKN